MSTVHIRTRIGLVGLLFPVLAIATTLTAAPAEAALTTAPTVLSLPAPTGPYPVGVRTRFVSDPTRIDPITHAPRALPTWIWYPAKPGTGQPARYLTPTVQAALEAGLVAPAGTFDIGTHARSGAVARTAVRGVLLLSPGLGGTAVFQTSQANELASQGWIVIGFDTPHDTFAVDQPDGTVIERDVPGTPAGSEQVFADKVLDTGVILNALSTLAPQWTQSLPVGMFGHSIGGAAAAESMRIYPVLRAGANLDGTPRGAVVTAGLDEPFGVMLSNVRVGLPVEDVELNTFLANLRGPHPVRRLYTMNHNGFTDFVVLSPQVLASDPALAGRIEENFTTDVTSVTDGVALVATQRSALADFMARYVRC